MIPISRLKGRPAKRVRELAGKLVGEHIRDSEWQELQALLTNSDEGRRAYIETMLLHAHLHHWGHKSQEL